MGDEFEIKDLGNLKYFLGTEVARSREGISVSQKKCTLDLLVETGMMGRCTAYMPIKFNVKLENSGDRISVDKEKYQRLVGKLIYLSDTRSDISYAISIVNQFMRAPYEDHMEAVNKILRYLKATPGKGLRFRKTDRRCIEAIQTLTGQNLLLIENPPWDTQPLCGTISLLGEARSKKLWLKGVLKLNTGL